MKKNSKILFWKENKGTTLVELLVIIAIMVIVTGSVLNLRGYLNGKQARQCAYKLEAALSEIRMETMSKSNGEKESVYFIIENNNGEIFAKQKIKESEKSDLIGQEVTVRVIDNKGLEKELKSGGTVSIYFDRATGGLHKEADLYTVIEISQGATTYIVEIEPVTGNIECRKK